METQMSLLLDARSPASQSAFWLLLFLGASKDLSLSFCRVHGPALGQGAAAPDAQFPSGLSLHRAFLALRTLRAGTRPETGLAAVGGSEVAPVWGSWRSEGGSDQGVS